MKKIVLLVFSVLTLCFFGERCGLFEESFEASALARGLTTGSATRFATGQDAKTRFRAPEGFVVEEAAAPADTGSLVAMTFDSKGRPVISRERGPVFILEDRDSDGRFETFKTFTDKVVNCQGLCFVGRSLYAVGDGPEKTGLYRIDDADGDDVGETVRLIGRFKGSMGEHGPHAVFFGPDGLLYLVVGNHAWVAATPDPLSPHGNFYEGQLLPSYPDPRGHARQIRAPGGTIWRLDLEGRKWELFAGGFRNHYDAAFNQLGELFTFDSDMEWDIDLPWYRVCRTDHIVPGGEFGWRTGSGKWPDYYPDSLPPLTDIGRGSPVGVEFYQHPFAYPAKYRDAFLLGDWSRGRILATFLEKSGATYTEKVEEFITGEPINIADLEVGPDGNVYFVNGGRNTEGGLYRIAYKGARPAPQSQRRVAVEALEQPQPRSAWGRAALEALKRRSGAAWGRELTAVAKNGAMNALDRARALELLQVYGPAPDEALLISLGSDAAWEVRAASTYYLGLHRTATARRELVRRMKDADPFVRRRAIEALIRSGINPLAAPEYSPVADLLPLLGDANRHVRFAARMLLERTERNSWREAVYRLTDTTAAIEGLLAVVRTMRGTPDIDEVLARELQLLRAWSGANGPTTAEKLALLRVIHLTLMNDQGVERPQLYKEFGELLLGHFPSSSWELNREIARTLAALQTAGATEKILAALKAEQKRDQQIFYVYALRHLRGEWTAERREQMVEWFARTQKERWRGGASFVGYLENMWNTWLDGLAPEEKTQAVARLEALAPAAAATAGAFKRKTDTGALSDQELSEYLLWDPMAYRVTETTIENGRKAYDKALCSQCHRFGEMGYEAGPDLTDVGRRFKRKDLIEAIIYPSQTISELWAATEIKTADGRTIVGVVTAEDARSVTLQDLSGVKTTIAQDQLRSRRTAATSMMPDGLLSNLTLREAVDLLIFLERGGK